MTPGSDTAITDARRPGTREAGGSVAGEAEPRFVMLETIREFGLECLAASGEELYAASAYLSGDPKLVGSLKGADLLKILIIASIIIGCVLETLRIHGFTHWMQTQ